MLFIRLLFVLLCLVWASPALAASPVVATTNTTADTDGTSTVINMPASISAGDLLVCWDTNDATLTPRAQSGGSDWTRISTGSNDGADDISMAIFAKIAAGSDTLTLAGAAQDSATACARITGHGVTNVSIDIMIGTPATGVDAAPNPPNVAHGGPQDYLVLESAHSDDDDDTATYWSSGYTGVAQIQSASSTTSCLTEVARLAVSNTAENPGVMALAATEQWVSQTISVPPALGTEYTKATDDFNRADENPLSGVGNWSTYTGAGDIQLVGNDIRDADITVADNAATHVVALTDAQWAKITASEFTTPGTGSSFVGVLLRWAAPSTRSGYLFYGRRNPAGGITVRIERVTAGVFTTLVEASTPTVSTNDVIKAYAIGTRLTLRVNNVSHLTVVDSSHTSGRAGAYVEVASTATITDAQGEDWSAGDFTAPAAACAGTRLLVGIGC